MSELKEKEYYNDIKDLKNKLKEMISKIDSAANPYGLTFLELYNKRRTLGNLLIVLEVGTPKKYKETTNDK